MQSLPTIKPNCWPHKGYKQMTTRELLRRATAALQDAGCDAPRLDAELLLMSAWSAGRTDLIIRALDEVPQSITKSFESMLTRRQQREPLAYITGEKEFWSRSFHVTADVLIPRPETEHLIEALLESFPEKQKAYHFCDIGTGSGCIAITLACEYPNAHVTATDISDAALNIAKHNAEALSVAERITFRCGDMLDALNDEDGPYDALLSNPPYVAQHEMAALESELAHEPQHALTDGEDGLSFLATILKRAPTRLKHHGFIMVETGLCGLPETPENLQLEKIIYDLAGLLRGARYKRAE